MTGVVPTGKVVPGATDGSWIDVPELSMDVGSSQLTVAPVLPNGTVTVISDGKLVTTGGVLSAVGSKILAM